MNSTGDNRTMKGMKQILLAGFAALCMVLPACHTPISGEEFARWAPLVISPEPLNTVSYTAEYTQDGALPFTCEVKLASDNRIRRDYVWKDEKGAEKKVSIVINGTEAIKVEDGKTSIPGISDTAMARFYSGLILDPAPLISCVWKQGNVWDLVPADVPGVARFYVCVDTDSRYWTDLIVRTGKVEDASGDASSVFSEYKTESGVTYPSRIVTSTNRGAPVTCVIRDVKINPELPDELFRLPEPNG